MSPFERESDRESLIQSDRQGWRSVLARHRARIETTERD